MRILLAIAVMIPVVLLAAGLFLYTPDESRASLEAKYHISPADYLNVAGIRLHVVDSGPREAPAVILLHGLGSSLQTFDAWAAGLSARYRVIRFDLPGFGLTGADPTGDYSDTRGLAVLSALMDHLGVAQAILIGNSMGGRLAWMFAATFPTRVTKLVLVSPDGFASPGFEYGRAPHVPLMLRALPYTLPKSMLRMTLEPAFADKRRITAQLVTRYWDFMRAPGVRSAIIARTEQTILHDPIPQLRKIEAPTLLLWGAEDAMIPPSNAADYMAAIPNCRLLTLPGLGHVPQEESPATTLLQIVDFLK